MTYACGRQHLVLTLQTQNPQPKKRVFVFYTWVYHTLTPLPRIRVNKAIGNVSRPSIKIKESVFWAIDESVPRMSPKWWDTLCIKVDATVCYPTALAFAFVLNLSSFLHFFFKNMKNNLYFSKFTKRLAMYYKTLFLHKALYYKITLSLSIHHTRTEFLSFKTNPVKTWKTLVFVMSLLT